jgi:hypothetical protein
MSAVVPVLIPNSWAVFDAHHDEIRRYIGRWLDPDVAEDLVAFRPPSSLRP